jgi:hypothetical protein
MSKYKGTPEQKERNRIYAKQWRAANPEKVREIRKRGRDKDPEKARERTRKWKAENPEARRAYARKWYAEHADRALIWCRAAYARKRVQKEFKAQQRKFREKRSADPSRRLGYLVSHAKHRAKARGFEFDEDLLAALKASPPARCACCAKELDYSISKGRRGLSPSLDRIDNTKGYTRANVAIICDRCNNIKGAATIERLVIRRDTMKHGTLRRKWIIVATIEELDNVIAYMRSHLL